METFDVYTAVILQTEVETVRKRAEIKTKNLRRIADIFERVGAYSASGKPPGCPSEYEMWAPVKLVALPEYCLQGNTFRYSMIDTAIEIPGEETDVFSDLARKHDVFISCVALERLPEFPGRYFNCNFIIGPDGKVIHKYHKFQATFHYELTTSPHDIYEEYYQVFGKGRTRLQTFFPVADTPIGKIGTLICHDGRVNENWRALALNGAEIIIHGNFVEPTTSPPRDHRELGPRWNAVANMVYVIAPQLGALIRPESVKYLQSGGSLIVDPDGAVIAHFPHPGEGMTSAVIRLDHLRRRRMDTGFNILAELRTEVYAEMFKESIYPPNALKEPIWDASEIYKKRDPRSLGVLQKLIDRGVLTPPKGFDPNSFGSAF